MVLILKIDFNYLIIFFKLREVYFLLRDWKLYSKLWIFLFFKECSFDFWCKNNFREEMLWIDIFKFELFDKYLGLGILDVWFFLGFMGIFFRFLDIFLLFKVCLLFCKRDLIYSLVIEIFLFDFIFILLRVLIIVFMIEIFIFELFWIFVFLIVLLIVLVCLLLKDIFLFFFIDMVLDEKMFLFRIKLL